MTTIAIRPTVPLSPVRREPGGSVVVGVLLAVLGTVVTAASWMLLVDDPSGRRLDHAVMVAAEDVLAPARTEILGLLHLVSVASVGVALAVLVGIGLSRRRPGTAAAAVALVLTSQLVTQGLKAALPRDGAGDNSLPSGHVTVVTALVVATLLVLPAVWRYPAGAVGAVLVAGSSVAVLAVGWHRPSDVVAAYGVVAALAGVLLVVAGLRRVAVRR